MHKITIINLQGETIAFSDARFGETISIGKGHDNQIILSDPSVSEKHLALEFDQKKIILHNYKSRNGVILNGERIKTEKSVVNEHDELKAGDFTVKITYTGEDSVPAATSEDRKADFLTWGFIILIFVLLFVLVMPEPSKPVKISEPFPVSEKLTPPRGHKDTTSWRALISNAKDAYFNDKILESAKLFKEVLSIQPENIEAKNFLEQIKKELVPQMEESIKTYIEERNIVSCASAVEELKLLDAENPMIEKAQGLLDGYSKFDDVRKLVDAHKFRQAQADIQSIVLVDEETLSEWRNKIDDEVFVTEAFTNAMNIYRSGPLPQAYKELKKFMNYSTLQKTLQTIARQKIMNIKRFAAFRKLENEDPLKQTTYGVGLLYDLTEKEDPLIWIHVNKRLDELTKQCGPGTDFYVLLKDDTFTQLEQARDYKNINEVKQALRNYRNALSGLRILAFFSKDSEFINLETNLYDEIVKYKKYLENKISEMKKFNEFDGARVIEEMLSKFTVSPSHNKKDDSAPAENYPGDGDDMKAVREIFNSAFVLNEDQNIQNRQNKTEVTMHMTPNVKESPAVKPESEKKEEKVNETAEIRPQAALKEPAEILSGT